MARIEFSAPQLSDARWRLSNLYWITDKTGHRTRFEMNWAQAALFDGMHYSNVILKARQLGMTTFIALYLLDQSLFNSHLKCGIIAHTLPDASAIFRDKVLFPYNNLPEALRIRIPTSRDSASELILANNSSIRVATSMRSGTLQYLHVSEYGKLCARFPEKARELRTGSLNTLAPGMITFIESTAEGREGHYFELCEQAQAAQRMGRPLTPLDFKFHFFPWHRCPEYVLPADGVVISEEHEHYFRKLREVAGVTLTTEQKAWYSKKAATQLADMKREFPSTPAEAFEAAVEGAYFSEQMAKAELDGRIGDHPAIPELPVNTAWDIGVGDSTAIWFWQQVPGKIGIVGYYENTGEGFPFYAGVLRDFTARLGWTYGEHLVPHDARVKEWGSGRSRIEQLVEAIDGVRLVTRSRIEDGINAVRATLPICYFDEAECAQGIKVLKGYRREWDEEKGAWKDKPRHDWASHGADAFRGLAMTWREVDAETIRDDPSRPRPPADLDYSKPAIEQVTLDWLWEAEREWRPSSERRY